MLQTSEEEKNGCDLSTVHPKIVPISQEKTCHIILPPDSQRFLGSRLDVAHSEITTSSPMSEPVPSGNSFADRSVQRTLSSSKWPQGKWRQRGNGYPRRLTPWAMPAASWSPS